ncbi:uncharacterized protein LOC113782927 [Coffea eugenioides]|uniref:Embryo defective 1923 n=1 Tax=Coffea arabica TaxID=13443 RepID=A0A6P6XJV7_COFAR|nr:uncharacterized protein LOC113743454 [Coffea arabica]XP_027151686.1 uncharacterized protein LOC113751764 [Coffea eugenioides]XP_027184704.1 uncharacterized protein LOC113782927 [Coffea eugenioides]
MSMITLSRLFSPNPSLKTPFKFKPSFQKPSFFTPTLNHSIPFYPSLDKANPFKLQGKRLPFGKNLGVTFDNKRSFGLFAKAEENEEMDKAELEARGQSTMPDRFRPLTKEAPDKPIRWPWFIALAFALYAWRTVLWELSNWKKAVAAIFQFLGYILKLALALVFHFIGDPITSLIRGIETTFYTIRASYSWVIAYAPIPELSTVIVLSSAVLAISEATVPDSVNSQPYMLTLAGLIGLAAVRSYISELFFWILLLGLFSFSRFVKKRDYVSSALPAAAVLAGVGEPWIRIIVLASYLALAIIQHSKQRSDGKENEVTGPVRRVPIPLLCAALAIGLRVAAKWAGYRHLTWMIA